MRVWENLVDPRFRSAGIGSCFIERAKTEARAKDARLIVLETQSCNVPAIRFYLKHGFDLIGFDIASYTNEDQKKREVRLEFGLRL
jgi:ribosomal protein S18 acetylase RimI-like enzyme